MSFRVWLSVFTVAVLALIVFFSRHEIYKAWLLLEHVNIWILLLLIPGQILVYYAGGEMSFTYLRSKKSIGHVSGPELARMALEMNFVNHALPSAGVSGMSYMTWRFGHYGVTPGRATMAQVVRYATSFASFITLLLLAVFIITIDGHINRWILLFSSLLVGAMVSVTALGMFLLSSTARINKFSKWLTATTNNLVKRLTFGRKTYVLNGAKVDTYFEELHQDYQALTRDRRMLIKPYLWGIVYAAGDAVLFMIAFLALGTFVNPAVILIAYGLASLAGFFVITPGGAGAYEAVMVAFLSVAGVTSDTAIAGILLARVILLLGTIILGYFFYQHAILHYGKHDKHPPAL